MKTIVFSDRDGTITYDENYYLGANHEWKKQVKIIETVVDGIKLIKSLKDTFFVIASNQAGVALKGKVDDKDFDSLTEERLTEVKLFVLAKLAEEGIKIDGYYDCPYVHDRYAKKVIEQRGWEVIPKYVQDDHPDIKPRTGMIHKAMKDLNLKVEDCQIFNIGDRSSDIELALNAGGIGILISAHKTEERGDYEKVLEMQKENPRKVFIAKDYLEAAKIIEDNSRK